MSLRRFEASSTPAALNAVREALGPEAIILSNRQVDGRVEIIAAGVIDDALLALASDLPTPVARTTVDTADRVALDATVEALPARRSSTVESPFASVAGASASATAPVATADIIAGSTDAPAASASAAGAAALPVRRVAGLVRGSRSETSGIDSSARHQLSVPWRDTSAPDRAPPSMASEQQPVGAAPLERTGEPPVGATTLEPAVNPGVIAAENPESDTSRNRSQDPSLNAAGLERVEARLRRIEIGLWGDRDDARSELLAKLLAIGLGPALALRLAERASGDTIEALLPDALALLQSSLPTVRDRTLERPGATLLAGPDARSRRDAMMKFANQHIEAVGPASLAFVCADSECPGAFDTLEAQGRELGVATVRARDAADLARALDSIADRSLVLVDCGRELPLDTLAVHASVAPRRLLVLSTCMQRGAARRAAAIARQAGADGCVLMQLAAPALPGELIDALVCERLPVAWWANSDSHGMPMQRAAAARIVASAVEIAQNVDDGDDHAALATFLQPLPPGASIGFAGAVQLGGCAGAIEHSGPTTCFEA